MQLADLSIVIPVHQDSAALSALLTQLAQWPCEVIVVDSRAAAQLPAHPDRDDCCGGRVSSGQKLRRLWSGVANRGAQLAQGAHAATGEWLWFVHADSRFGGDLQTQFESLNAPAWGCFDARIEPRSPLLGCVAFMMNRRSRLTGICTGDQGIFSHRSLIERTAGMPAQPLMEDIELSLRLKRVARPVRLAGPMLTSARRWQRLGAWRTIIGMWRLRWRYWLGASPDLLAAEYYARPRPPADR